MLIHDLLDLAPKVPEVDVLLKFYNIQYYQGAYTMALPRLGVVTKGAFIVNTKRSKKRG
jgi:hypothetical protein